MREQPDACICFFCSKTIDHGDLDPCALQVVARVDRPRGAQKEQTFFCHFVCLQAHCGIHEGNLYIADSDFPTVGDIDAAH